MGANIGWSHGTDGEYRTIAATLNTASPQALRTFVYALRAGVDFDEAHRLAFPSLMPATYEAVAERWYSDRSFWFGDSVLTPGQIHEVACESRARLAECLLAGARKVHIGISCAFEQMSATLAWPGCTRADAEMLGDAELWSPASVADQEVYLLLRTPFNSGYHKTDAPPTGLVPQWTEPVPGGDLPTQAARELDLMKAEIADGLVDKGHKPGAWRTDPVADSDRRSLLRNLRERRPDRLVYTTMYSPANTTLFTDTVLGVVGGAQRPGRGGLVTSFEDRFATPPPLAPGIATVIGGYQANAIDMPWRATPAVTITWGSPIVEAPSGRW